MSAPLCLCVQAPVQSRRTVSDSVRAALQQIGPVTITVTVIIRMITQWIHNKGLSTTNSPGRRRIPVLFVLMMRFHTFHPS